MSNEEQTNIVSDMETTATCEAVANRENMIADMTKNLWGYDEKGIEAKKAAMAMLSTKTGMYARIPLICKADNCPYAESCQLLKYNLAPESNPCPIETSQIEIRLAGYQEDFGDFSKCSFTDKILISDLINQDIMLERCKSLIAKDQLLVKDEFAGISEDGEVFYKPEVSKHLDAYERIQKRRNEIYDLMMATRKNNKNDNVSEDGLSKTLSAFFNGETKFVEEEMPDNIVDIDDIR